MKRLRPGTWQRRMVSAGLQTLRMTKHYGIDARENLRHAVAGSAPVSYRSWKRDSPPAKPILEHQQRLVADSPHGPRVRVLVVGRGDVVATQRSLQDQSSSMWDLVEVPSIEELGSAISDLSVGADPTDLVVIAEPGDVFRADFVFRVADAAWTNPESVLVHWDDDVNGRSPRFRPEWSPEMLFSANYLGRALAVRVRELAAFEPIYDDVVSNVWKFLLGLDLTTDRVVRVPEVLESLHGRWAEGTPLGVDIVDDALSDREMAATAESGDDCVLVKWRVDSPPLVSIVIPTRHNRELIGPCLESISAGNYPNVEVVVVDNGTESIENAAWYERFDLDLKVLWWDKPFNYSAVNNSGAAAASGDVLVFLNDDTVILDHDWLQDLVGWASSPGIGVVGVQLLDPEGLIQHGGVVLGISGFADHLFAAMAPGSDTIFGSTNWYRNCSAVTGACVAVTRQRFEEIGEFDESFELCGSDVALGLRALIHGYRNVVTPRHLVRHLESATRGTNVPYGDLYASYWRYQRFVRAGDRYWSPNLSLRTGVPKLRSKYEPEPVTWISNALNRNLKVFKQSTSEEEIHSLVAESALVETNITAGLSRHAGISGRHMPRTLNWFVPDLDSPFYGGINTALRMADHLKRHHGVQNRFVVWGSPDERWIRSGITAAFPDLSDVEIAFVDGNEGSYLDTVPEAEAAICTLWLTAYQLAAFNKAQRRFYMVQDFEPMFYPAGSLYALAEETYRLGLYGVCNTDNLRNIYTEDYGGVAASFWPAVDRELFHPDGRRPLDSDGPTRIFLYARPGHWRNCWEIARPALVKLKRELGDQVRIVTAGSWARPSDVGIGIEHLGLLDVFETADLYRKTDIGIALTVSAHPSYLPLEFMACGTPVVAFDNPAGHWLLHDDVNSRLCRRHPESLFESLRDLCGSPGDRVRLGRGALDTIDRDFSDWHATGERFAEIISDPQNCATTGPAVHPGGHGRYNPGP